MTQEEKKTLREEIIALLEEYDYCPAIFAINKIIDEWAEQKATLLEAFKKHPNYIKGQYMIAFDSDYERDVDVKVVNRFYDWLFDRVRNDSYLLPQEIRDKVLEEGTTWLPHAIFNTFNRLTGEQNRIIGDYFVQCANEDFPQIHAHSGEKTSRVVNKICKYLGYDKHPDYNREYAKFADALSPLKIKRHTVISLHPIDYLTMSFGNSWASCHTIDKQNRRGMPNAYEGQYSSGTMSYMLDPSSIVFYTVDKSYDGTEYYTQPKINRQMFHWGEQKLVQGRLYPQSCDSSPEEYTPYRNIMQQIMSVIFDFPNLWSCSKGCDNASEYIVSRGTHYRDYAYVDNCTLSRIKGVENNNKFVVGAEPICIECGCRHDLTENISHCASSSRECYHCGCVVDEEDGYWIDDEFYCDDCTCTCACCDDICVEEDATYVSGHGYICDYCLEEHFRECEECGVYTHYDELTYVESEDGYFCESCIERYFVECGECGELIRKTWANKHPDTGVPICDDCYGELEEEDENE